MLAGRVAQAGDTSITVGGASLELTGTGRRIYADRDGRFTFGNVPAGDYDLRVRRLGYQPLTRHISLAAGTGMEETFELPRLAGALTSVRIEGRMVKVPARFENAYRRGSSGWGRFITREMIDSLHPLDTKRLFEGIPTVRVGDGGITFTKCMDQVGTAAKSNVQVFVDGRGATVFDADDVNSVLESIHPLEMQAMEIYTGVARIPAEFLNDACAVVAIWTKSY